MYYQNKLFGKIVDIAVVENRPTPPISKIVVVRHDKKLTIPPSVVTFENGKISLKTHDVPFLPFDEKDFYLSENLLDKQVIDIDGKRVVRVNDVLLENDGELKAVGIDIGFAGVLRRLGILSLTPIRVKSKTLPWALIQAFDYQTGAIQLRITQNRLNTFHPSEIAEILEDVGTKERLGIVNVLDAQKAAIAIEKADSETQLSIIELLSSTNLKSILNKMLVSEIADIFYKLNPLRVKEISKVLGNEKMQRVEKLSEFPNDTAGGLMQLSYVKIDGGKTIKELFRLLAEEQLKPETVVITNGHERVQGVVNTKDLVNNDQLAMLKDMLSAKQYVFPETRLEQIVKLFAHYNLRSIPVVDKNRQILGVIPINILLAKMYEQKERNDII